MDDRLKTIADHYGLDSQLNILQEELSELIQAVSKYRRGDPSHILEEIADVEIMLDQVKYLLGNPEIPRVVVEKFIKIIREDKIKRQLNRIQEEAGNNGKQGSNQSEQ